jgi:hypothetical protein
MEMKKLIFSITIMVFLSLLIGCKMDSEPTYTVWVFTESYSNYQSTFGSLNDGSYRRTEMFSGEINYSAIPTEFKRNWTENDIYNWLHGRDFISSEAREVTSWIVSTRHCIIASRSGSIVHMLIK